MWLTKKALVKKSNELQAETFTSESGMATAEYAVGTVAATTLGGILLWIIQQPWVKEFLIKVIENIFAGLAL